MRPGFCQTHEKPASFCIVCMQRDRRIHLSKFIRELQKNMHLHESKENRITKDGKKKRYLSHRYSLSKRNWDNLTFGLRDED